MYFRHKLKTSSNFTTDKDRYDFMIIFCLFLIFKNHKYFLYKI